MKNNNELSRIDYTDRPVGLTIAGSDSGGGAGIQADLKTYSFYGLHGTSAITSVTAQNSRGVQNVQDLPPSIVRDQIQSVMNDFDVDTVKVGMVSHAEIIEVIAECLEQQNPEYVVVDPVMVAESGDPLFNPEDKEAMRTKLFPLASVVTPNIPEAELLLNTSIDSAGEMEESALEMSQLLNVPVVLTGGHLKGEPTDVIAEEGEIHQIKGFEVPRDTSHGSGCAYSTSIASNLIRESELRSCAQQAKQYVSEAIRWGSNEGTETGCVEPGWGKFRAVEERKGRTELMAALDNLRNTDFVELMPEVQSNFVYCIDHPSSMEDILGFPGRINKVNGQIRVHEAPQTGASQHMASLLLKAHQYRPEIRSAINVCYSKDLVNAAENAGLETHEHMREEEPEDIRAQEGASMPYVIERAFKLHGSIPDVIYDTGDVGKEAMTRIFGNDPADVAGKLQMILNHR